jgi:cellulose synthase/poly-beta-1,6-N-acetylglucosamine synthase-like glycosyltransferase
MLPLNVGPGVDLGEDQQDRPTKMQSDQPKLHLQSHYVTAIIPAYNEAASIAATIRSLQAQTCPMSEIIVVDDCSTDDTGRIALEHGATLLRPPHNTGSKAGAQSYALSYVQTEFCIAIDADTEVSPDGVGLLMQPFTDADVAATCGFVIPRHIKTVWERGRYIEYLFAFTFFKAV